MDTKTLQEAANRVAKIMLARGLRNPSMQFNVESDAQPNGYARWDVVKGVGEWTDYKYEWFKADGWEGVIAAAYLWAEDLPSIEQTRQQEFMKALAATIELGKANGIDAALVNPLEAAMKKLSKNALTHEGSK